MSRGENSRWGFNTWFVIGKQDNPMMKRWRLLQTPWGGIYLHFIYREDLDPVPHDHPWNFWRLVLKGGYIEEYWSDPASGQPLLRTQQWLRLGRVPTTHAHRITFVFPGTISLVIVGRKRRVWGFWTDRHLLGYSYGRAIWGSRIWVDYRDYLGLRPQEGVTG